MAAERKLTWRVSGDSSFITLHEYETETELNFCWKRKNGTTGVLKKHPTGTDFVYFPTWEEANAEVIRRAEADLARTIASIEAKKRHLELLKTRTKKTAYDI